MKDSDTLLSEKRRALRETERLAELCQQSNLIFVGTVVDSGEPPTFWSGRLPAYQMVSYEVEEILKGTEIPKIAVHHIVVKDSKTATSGNEPSLSPDLFRKGSKLIVFAEKADDGTWRCLDEEIGALKYSDESYQKIKNSLGK